MGNYASSFVTASHILLTWFGGTVDPRSGLSCGPTLGDRQDPGCGEGDWDWETPAQCWELVGGFGELGGGDQESEVPERCQQSCSGGEHVGEPVYCPESDQGGGSGRMVLRSIGKYIDVCQCKCANDFSQKRDFLVIGLDQGDSDTGRPDLHGDAGEAGAGADVEDEGVWAGVCFTLEEVARGEYGFAEVTSDDFVGSANSGEIDAGIPAQQKIDVRRYMIELGRSEVRGFEKRLQEFGDTSSVHEVREMIVEGLGCRWNRRVRRKAEQWKPTLRRNEREVRVGHPAGASLRSG